MLKIANLIYFIYTFFNFYVSIFLFSNKMYFLLDRNLTRNSGKDKKNPPFFTSLREFFFTLTAP